VLFARRFARSVRAQSVAVVALTKISAQCLPVATLFWGRASAEVLKILNSYGALSAIAMSDQTHVC